MCTIYCQRCNDLYLKVKNAEFHAKSNESKIVHIVKYEWKELRICTEKA